MNIGNSNAILVLVDCNGHVYSETVKQMYPIFEYEHKQDCKYLMVNPGEIKVYPMFDGKLILSLAVSLSRQHSMDLDGIDHLVEKKCRELSIDKIYVSDEALNFDDKKKLLALKNLDCTNGKHVHDQNG